MKATGIVRRIDDLGRVVIPKEIRRTMRIREGDPLEIFTDRNGEVIFKKYSPLGELTNFATDLCDTITKIVGFSCAFCDKDAIICASGAGKKDVLELKISRDIEGIIESRNIYTQEDTASVLISDATDKFFVKAACPIISEGDALGAVIVFDTESQNKLVEGDIKVMLSSAMFLSKHMST